MNRGDLYGHLPSLLKRLFTLGLGSATLFLVLWYYGGYNIWGYFLDFCMNITAPFYGLTFESGTTSTASFWHTVTIEGNTTELEFKINLLSTHMVQVVTLLAIWPYRNKTHFFRLAAWCLLFTVLYQTFNVVIQTYYIQIGPKLATRLEIFWEDSFWFRVVRKIAVFDKLILRYWAGFPIFMFAFLADAFFGAKVESKKARQKK